jgi:hypothetical protein
MKKESAKKRWKDPVKGHEAKESTLDTQGDFAGFLKLMKRVVRVKPPREATSASPGPVASS